MRREGKGEKGGEKRKRKKPTQCSNRLNFELLTRIGLAVTFPQPDQVKGVTKPNLVQPIPIPITEALRYVWRGPAFAVGHQLENMDERNDMNQN